MGVEPVRLTREALYKQVWAEPMSTLAQRYGLSDVGLAKICRRMWVPAPGRGYWRKREVGRKVGPAPLPKLPHAGPEMREVVLHGSRTGEAEVEATGPVADQERFERREENRIRVAEVLTDPYPLVAQTVVALRRAKPDGQGILQPRTACLAVYVTLDGADRAMCILDALLKALDARGFSTSVRSPTTDGAKVRTVVRIGEEDVGISLTERVDRVPRQPVTRPKNTPRGPRNAQRPYFPPLADMHPTSHREERDEWVGSGQLTLKIEEYCPGLRCTWADGKQQRVDQSLNAFIVGLVGAGEALRVRRLENEAREREWRAAEARRAEEARRREEEAGRIRSLDRAVDRWREARLVREYVVEMRTAADRAGIGEPGSPLADWLAWASAYADRIDPLLPEPSVPQDPGRRDRFGYPVSPQSLPSYSYGEETP